MLNYPDFPAAQVLVRRLVEIELHHTDLGSGYGPADWPAGFTNMELDEPMCSQRNDRIPANRHTRQRVLTPARAKNSLTNGRTALPVRAQHF